MKRFSLILLFLLAPALASAADPVPLIFDTDMGNDIDDALALALIHALESRGECRLIGVTLTKDHPQAAPFVDTINTFYGRGAIPVGIVKNGKGRKGSTYLDVCTTKRPDGNFLWAHDLVNSEGAEDAVRLLRRLLAGVQDRSALIVQVGFSTNLAALLASAPDDMSPLSGPDLVRQKVALLSVMAGNFAKPTPEFNVKEDIASAQKLLREWPGEVVMSGFEIGLALLYPAVSIESDFVPAGSHPVVLAYRAYGKMPYDRPTWDLTSVLCGVRPTRGYFNLSELGQVTVADDGVTGFEKKAGGRHRYLILTPEQKVKTLEALVQLASQPTCQR